jgi:hypothetical protein
MMGSIPLALARFFDFFTNSSNYDETKLSWERKLNCDNFSFQFVMINDSS